MGGDTITATMSKIVRYEFMGSWLMFWLLCITIIGIPLAVLYFVNGTVRVEDELDEPELVLEKLRSRR
jgi:hypothetical protein